MDNPNVGKVYRGKSKQADFSFFLGGNVVKVNGEQVDVAGKTVESYLREQGYTSSRVAVELNGDILPKSRYGETFKDGDSVEIVNFVGGG